MNFISFLKKYAILIVVIILLDTITIYSTEIINYNAITTEEKYDITWTIKKVGKYHQLIVQDHKHKVVNNLLKNNTTSIDVYENNKKNLSISRFKNQFKLKLFNKRKVKKKSLKILNTNWFQYPGYSLKDFVLSNQKKIEFCKYDFTNKGVIKLVATKTGKDVFNINGKKVDVIQVKISPPGVLTLFWSMHIWFDVSNGRMVMFDGSLTGPSGKKTIIKYDSHEFIKAVSE